MHVIDVLNYWIHNYLKAHDSSNGSLITKISIFFSTKELIFLALRFYVRDGTVSFNKNTKYQSV